MKLEKCGGLNVLTNLSNEEKLQIKHDLTLDNPDYVSAKNFGRGRFTNIKPNLFFYSNVGGALIVPRGYSVPFKIDSEVDSTNEITVKYPKLKIELRDTQKVAFNEWSKDPSKGVTVLPTGKGKSIYGAYLAYAKRQKALIIVQKNDLVDGWKKDIMTMFPSIRPKKIGLIKSGVFRVGEQYTITTIQTLSKLSSKELAELYSTFGMIITDECLVGNTLVALEDGGVKYIKDIVDEDNLIGGKVSNAFSRKARICKVITKHSNLEGSYTHPTFVLSKSKINPKSKNIFSESDLEVKCLKDIEEGDYVPVIKNIPHTTKYKWTKDNLSFVALIMADGHIDKDINSSRIKINVTKDKEWYLDTFTRGAKSFGNYEVKSSYDCRGNLTAWVNSKELINTLTGVFSIPRGKKSNNLDINEQIQYAPIESVKAFIETLFSCESSLSVTNKSNRINIEMSCERFIKKLNHILKKFSIITSYPVIEQQLGEHSDSFRLSIDGEDFNTFFNTFTLITRKTTLERNVGDFNGYDIGNYRLVKVKKVTLTNRFTKVYDYTTTTHKFIANGIMTHNCHHSPASSYGILKYFRSKYFVGLTATDMREDGLQKVLYWMFGDVCYRHPESVDDEDIMPFSVVFRNSNIKYQPETEYDKRGRVIPLNINELRKVISSSSKFNDLVASDIIKEYNLKKSCIVFLHEKDHIRYLADLLIRKGVNKDKLQLYYGDAKESDSVMKERAESKEVLITLATYSKATEGTNVKAWERCFLVSSLNNEKGVIQAVGRARRRCKGKVDVKVYDYAHPNIKSVCKHIHTRMRAYKSLKAIFSNSTPTTKNTGLITKGWNYKK